MRKRKFYLGFQFSLFNDAQGMKLAYKVIFFKYHRERTYFLKRNPNWGKGDPELTPKLPYVEILTKMPSGKALEPEDI